MTTDVETFKKLYLQEFGVVLTDEDAEKLSASLKRLYIAVYGSPATTTYEQRLN